MPEFKKLEQVDSFIENNKGKYPSIEEEYAILPEDEKKEKFVFVPYFHKKNKVLVVDFNTCVCEVFLRAGSKGNDISFSTKKMDGMGVVVIAYCNENKNNQFCDVFSLTSSIDGKKVSFIAKKASGAEFVSGCNNYYSGSNGCFSDDLVIYKNKNTTLGSCRVFDSVKVVPAVPCCSEVEDGENLFNIF